MNGIKVLILDFDNCLILDQKTREGSEELKDKAWFEVFSEYDPDILKSMIETAKKEFVGGKGDRNGLIISLCRRFGIEDSKIKEESIKRLSHFDEIMQRGIKEIGISKEVRDFLSTFSSKISIYLNTATPVENASRSLDLLGIREFFKGIYGRPGTKLDNMKAILASEPVNPDEILFVDDQEDSRQIAKELGCKFVGIHTARNKVWHENPQPFPIIRSIEELSDLVI
ncbi:MAG: hypothetical protein A3G05_02165 [Candidatus Zambryskibacteria bacterium RIFCSPLOWO2_12_FULL_45_14]|uniref:FCP1 homology domain-containing protein n=2 Tax=Candidatus Zambryskiibacteriota TaxID=1817925 RepID=A0A1G2UNI2_9BACT|nr:MAG: hypothetical protein A3H60_02125 [Candidatus Zambryskibacteria bacterium RIFCSPLOWO2_02_FULL_44_12b]OHB13710.1 MAG: hypothetical protein A3G05_02165 [Candidatus Zambryskibacteria bacterium RIFCSPLOWO2_12_FULL_45_14]